MMNAFQLASIRSDRTEVCDPDHMKIFAAPPADLAPLYTSWPPKPIQNRLAYVGVRS